MTQMIIANNRSMVAVNGMMAQRMVTIDNRISNPMMAAVKAGLIHELKAKMASGVAHFIYVKKDGTLREAWGTTQPNLAKAMTCGSVSRELFKTTAYFDVQAGGWRSFRWENIVKVF